MRNLPLQKRTIAAAILLGLAVPALAQQPALTGDAKEAHKKIAICEGCHGIAGYRTVYPSTYRVPKLGGQQEGYIVSALHAYKAGQRSHPSMLGNARSLSDQDIADIAAYYSQSHAK